jgi:hypothetical protein
MQLLPEKYIRRYHSISWPGIIPSVSIVRRQKRRPEGNILQGEFGKIKPPIFNGEHMKGE